MNCEEARELIGADPDSASPQLLAHLESCPHCQVYREQMLRLNAQIRQALDFDVRAFQLAPLGQPARPGTREPEDLAPGAPQPGAPQPGAPQPTALEAAGRAANFAEAGSPSAAAGLPGASLPSPQSAGAPTSPRANVIPFSRASARADRKPPRARRGVAVAASLAAALLVVFTLWLSRPTETLASEVVAHVEHEPNSWNRTQPIPAAELEAVLRKSGVKMGVGLGPVVYASSCWFRGRFVPHLVVTTPSGPVTVMVLKNEPVPREQPFNEEGFSGLLVPAAQGSVAILSRTPMELKQPARDVLQALQAPHN